MPELLPFLHLFLRLFTGFAFRNKKGDGGGGRNIFSRNYMALGADMSARSTAKDFSSLPKQTKSRNS
jgi:hypothetical protein